MKKSIKKFAVGAIALSAVLGLTSCSTETDAQVASKNLAQACDEFECVRRITFMNTRLGTEPLVIEGACSITDANRQLEATCKTTDGEFLKHILGLSTDVTYISEQLQSKDVSTSRYRVDIKPLGGLPDYRLNLD